MKKKKPFNPKKPFWLDKRCPIRKDSGKELTMNSMALKVLFIKHHLERMSHRDKNLYWILHNELYYYTLIYISQGQSVSMSGLCAV